jgi:uncharacterized protein YgbK (DUF1537 family)
MHAAIIADDLTGAADSAQMVAALVRPLTISLRKMIAPCQYPSARIILAPLRQATIPWGVSVAPDTG